MNSAFKLIAALIIATALCGCGGGGGRSGGSVYSSGESPVTTLAEAQGQGTWTILVYLDADNDLESAGVNNFNQMEALGSTKDIRIVVQMDRCVGEDDSNGDWTDTRRYLITKDSDTNLMNSIRLDSSPLGELDMANPQTLRDFVTWGEQEFPADHYCLIIWNHGGGWQFRSFAAQPEFKYVLIDDASNSQMNVNEIPTALSGLNIDVIAFDACYMQEIEVAYELRNTARYMVGSASVEPSSGYNYTRWLNRIMVDTTPEGLSRAIVDAYAAEYPYPRTGITQSALDLSRVSEVTNAMTQLAHVLEANASTQSTALRSARNAALNYSSGGAQQFSFDLLDYANRCKNAIGTDAQDAYNSLANAMSDMVIASVHNSDMPTANGFGIYIPSPDYYDSRYEQLNIAADTEWDEWLKAQNQ